MVLSVSFSYQHVALIFHVFHACPKPYHLTLRHLIILIPAVLTAVPHQVSPSSCHFVFLTDRVMIPTGRSGRTWRDGGGLLVGAADYSTILLLLLLLLLLLQT